MSFFSMFVGLSVLLMANMPMPDPGTSVVTFGDTEVSTMLTANKVMPATFFTNCIRSPLTVVLNSQSTIDWQMTDGMANATCSDSVKTWTMTPTQRQKWNATSLTVKASFLTAMATYRSYALQRPSASCTVSGLSTASPSPYTSVSASADPANPERFLITLTTQPGGSPNVPTTPTGNE